MVCYKQLLGMTYLEFIPKIIYSGSLDVRKKKSTGYKCMSVPMKMLGYNIIVIYSYNFPWPEHSE